MNIMSIRVDGNGQLVNAQPCCMCVNLMKEAGIYRCYYSNDDGLICCVRIGDVDTNTYTYASKGLDQMLRKNPEFSKTGKFPLTYQQKHLFMTDKVKRAELITYDTPLITQRPPSPHSPKKASYEKPKSPRTSIKAPRDKPKSPRNSPNKPKTPIIPPNLP